MFKCENCVTNYKCDKCNFNADLWITLLGHIRNSCNSDHTYSKLTCTSKRSYICENCDFTSDSLLVLLAHERSCTCIVNCNHFGYNTNRTKKRSATNFSSHENKLEPCATFQVQRLCHATLEDGKEEDSKFHTVPDLYACDSCSYKAKKKFTLNRHIKLQHEDPKNVIWFECDKCDYKTKMKGHLKQHIQYKHFFQNPIEFECGQCFFKSRHKNSLQRHIIKQHTYPEEMKWFYCDHKEKLDANLRQHQCSFKTLYEKALRRHMGSYHTEHAKIKWFQNEQNQVQYECKQCCFQTYHKSSIKRHVNSQHTRLKK